MFSNWIQAYSARDNLTYEVKKALKRFLGQLIPDEYMPMGRVKTVRQSKSLIYLLIQVLRIDHKAMG